MRYRPTVPDRQETPLDYAEFVAGKLRANPPTADKPTVLPDWPLFPWQRAITELALERGRAAIFADTGMGKTRMELAWAHAVAMATGKLVLLLAPLAVGKQTVREAEAIGAGAEVHYRSTADEIEPDDRVIVTNYERIHHFEPIIPILGGIVLDESSILKALDGKTRKLLTEFAATIPYRLCATATPAPNDYIELGQHAEFLGVLNAKEMMALYFTQDGNSTQKWRLKGHARESFWRWVASWSTAMRRPSDVGYPEGDPMYELPPLNVHQVEVEAESQHATGMLFKMEANTLAERREARKATLNERVAAAVKIIEAEPGEQWLVWCDLNDESHALAKAIPGSAEVKGSDPNEWKEAAIEWFTGRMCLCGTEFERKLSAWPTTRNTSAATTSRTASGDSLNPSLTSESTPTSEPSTCGPTTRPTPTSSRDGRRSSKPSTTAAGTSDTQTTPSIGNDSRPPLATATSGLSEMVDSGPSSESGLTTTTPCWPSRAEGAPSAEPNQATDPAADFTSITATDEDMSEAFSAPRATSASASSPTTPSGLNAPRCTCGHADGGRTLISKPSMFGHGLNLQVAARVVFVGLSDSFERYYQAVRRSWRFGQTRPVEVYVVTADVEGAVVRNIQDKQRKAEAMQDELVRAMAAPQGGHLKMHSTGLYEIPMEVPEWLAAA